MKLSDFESQALVLWYGSDYFKNNYADGRRISIDSYKEYDRKRSEFIKYYVDKNCHLKLIKEE